MVLFNSLGLFVPLFLSSVGGASLPPEEVSLHIDQIRIEYENIEPDRNNNFISKALIVNLTVKGTSHSIMADKESGFSTTTWHDFGAYKLTLETDTLPKLAFSPDPGPLFIEDHPWLLDPELPDGKDEYYAEELLPNVIIYGDVLLNVELSDKWGRFSGEVKLDPQPWDVEYDRINEMFIATLRFDNPSLRANLAPLENVYFP